MKRKGKKRKGVFVILLFSLINLGVILQENMTTNSVFAYDLRINDGNYLNSAFDCVFIDIEFSSNDLKTTLCATGLNDPRDSYITIQTSTEILDWGIDRVNPEIFWGIPETEDNTNVAIAYHDYDGDGVNIAILDSGIDYNHPDLVDCYAGGYDFVEEDSQPMDVNGHGTFVAGVIAAKDDDNYVLGLVPDANIYALKILQNNGDVDGYAFEDALQWCIDTHYDSDPDNDIHIINMSFGGSDVLSYIYDDISAASELGIVLIGAAGNEGEDEVSWPANIFDVIAVGAIDENDELCDSNDWLSGSNYGNDLFVVAPGKAIMSTFPTHEVFYLHTEKGYDLYMDEMGGTSAATPIVTGMVALLLSRYPFLTNDDVRNILHDYSEQLEVGVSQGEHSYYFGYGCVNGDLIFDDEDNDGLIKYIEEEILFTNPTLTDTDGDGLGDSVEFYFSNTDPTEADIDEDGLDDSEEWATVHSDPYNPDSDNDGLLDGDEYYIYYTNPIVSDVDLDSDSDGLTNVSEVDVHNTNPTNPDSDSDGFTDGEEVLNFFTDPNDDTSLPPYEIPNPCRSFYGFPLGNGKIDLVWAHPTNYWTGNAQYTKWYFRLEIYYGGWQTIYYGTNSYKNSYQPPSTYSKYLYRVRCYNQYISTYSTAITWYGSASSGGGGGPMSFDNHVFASLKTTNISMLPVFISFLGIAFVTTKILRERSKYLLK